MSERQELVVAVGDLYRIIQKMWARYSDDVSPNRADDMERLYLQAEPIAQPIIDRYPFGYGRKDRDYLKGQGS
ncbi:hypothetical protein LZK98_11680 [Sphingomonas cannabina]|uniref:hypothetical protein n=1 Tax=Sphingomonas cannabina TaxID=2899123 RepID=UPI001F24A09E|nr:hypothetical protein [Sphingomonas cannabina]UIJ43751.1 hypothetical protein LZK98_11680 [Sphingomonas cannabina]